MQAKLVSLAGPPEGSAFALGEGELSIGREHGNALRIKQTDVSRRHCVIRKQEQRFSIHDLGSRNGTYVNNVPVRDRLLQHNDTVKIGHSLFVFLVEGAEAGAELGAARLDDGALVTGHTVVLKREDALYLKPEKVAAVLPKVRMARDLESLLRIGAAISSIREVEALQEQLLKLIFEAIPAERGAILLRSSTSGEFSSVFSRTRRAATEPPMNVSRTVVERVWREGVALLSNEVLDQRSDPSESLIQAQVKSLLAVPLALPRKPLGVIYLDAIDPRVRFEQNDLELLTGIAGTAAVALDHALEVRNLENENRRLMEELDIQHDLVGESAAMQQVCEFIAKAAGTSAAVLICGESGTGKELAARAIHRNSPRATKPFVVINCAALSETLLERELFGYEKGAFAGAVAQKRGKLEQGAGGSVFLDEVGELTPALQAKLLRALEEQEFVRVGGTLPIQADLRLIAATNRDLAAAVRNHEFHEDLYRRLNVVAFEIPPLRERKEDIPLLANYFAQKHSRSLGRRVTGFSEQAFACLINYDWPGNVRELQNAIERAVVLGETDTILLEDLPDLKLTDLPKK